MRAGQGLNALSHYNTNVVIHALRRLREASQTDLVRKTGLSAQTVSVIVRDLVEQGVMREIGRRPVGRGRPRTLLELDGSSVHAVGLHIDPSQMSAVILNIRGETVASAVSDKVDPDDGAATMDVAAGLITGLCERQGLTVQSLAGVAITTPGPLDRDAQVITNPVWLPGWVDFPPGVELAKRLGLDDVPLVKDTYAAVTGETWVRAGSSLESTMVFIYIGTGIGVGISLNGDPVGGASGNAGEIGRIMVALAAEGRDASEQHDVGTDNDPLVLIRRAHELGILGGDPPKARDTRSLEGEFRSLTRLAREGDEGARALIQRAADVVGALATIAAQLVDADLMVFGGPYWEMVSEWYGTAARIALDRSSARGTRPIRVLSSAMGDEVGAIGAASVILDRQFVPRQAGFRP